MKIVPATILRGNISTAVSLERLIPEFLQPHTEQEYARRLALANPLILIAEVDGLPAGYKVGYDRYRDGSYYSWVGGVLPTFRRQGIAEKLADAQEDWAASQGHTRIILKTQEKYSGMIAFAQKRGFILINVDVTEKGEVLVLEKKL
ncbi:GNAT family N-acetyltransferase [Candidatus Woesearchaeota archaeon]|nr:MAG: GNAT family N-acetyltransferase [Candidatus Woesearchaeota archaeon]